MTINLRASFKGSSFLSSAAGDKVATMDFWNYNGSKTMLFGGIRKLMERTDISYF